MYLFLMRHGDALPVGGAVTEDAQRPLSPAGRRQVRRVAAGFLRRQPKVEAIYSSPLIRARETARIMAEELKPAVCEPVPALAPTHSPAGLRELISQPTYREALLLVGHHPDVTLWTAFLTGLDSSVCPLFGTASIAALSFDPALAKADLLWFQTSDQLSQR